MNYFFTLLLASLLFSCGSDDDNEEENYLKEAREHKEFLHRHKAKNDKAWEESEKRWQDHVKRNPSLAKHLEESLNFDYYSFSTGNWQIVSIKFRDGSTNEFLQELLQKSRDKVVSINYATFDYDNVHAIVEKITNASMHIRDNTGPTLLHANSGFADQILMMLKTDDNNLLLVTGNGTDATDFTPITQIAAAYQGGPFAFKNLHIELKKIDD